MSDRIIESVESPHALEQLYRGNPEAFTRDFPDAFAARPDSMALQVWHERLFFNAERNTPTPPAAISWQAWDIGLAIGLSFVAGTLMKLPHFFATMDEERFYERNLASIILGALIISFCVQRRMRAKAVGGILAIFAGAVLFLNLLPDMSDSQTILLSAVHMPFLLWSLLGITFMGGTWKSISWRMDYVRFNGELLIYTTVILIGGVVLYLVTYQLFLLIELDIVWWYERNVVVYGATASPIVATLLIERVARYRFKIAPLLARMFTPLFLLTVIAYMVAMVVNRKSPFTDRDFLISFNVLLFLVLGLSVFSITERNPNRGVGIADMMNIGLVSVTLLIDMVALAAILFRLTSYGFTPNRLAVLGVNLLVFCHLAGILYLYLQFAWKNRPIERLDAWIAGYIPAYTVWSLIVAIGFPLALGFR